MIPEQRTHAKRADAYGTLTVTHGISRYTRAKTVSVIGKRARKFARLLTLAGERGAEGAVVQHHASGRPGCRRTSFTTNRQLREDRLGLWRGHHGDLGAAGGVHEASGPGWRCGTGRGTGGKVPVYGSVIRCAAGFSIDLGAPMASMLHDVPDSPGVGVCSTPFDDVCNGCG